MAHENGTANSHRTSVWKWFMPPNKVTHEGHICCLLIWYIIQKKPLLGLPCYLFILFRVPILSSATLRQWWAYLGLHGSSSSRHLGKNLTSVKVTLLRTRLLDKKGDTSALETQLLSFLHENMAASCGADRNLTVLYMIQICVYVTLKRGLGQPCNECLLSIHNVWSPNSKKEK